MRYGLWLSPCQRFCTAGPLRSHGLRCQPLRRRPRGPHGRLNDACSKHRARTDLARVANASRCPLLAGFSALEWMKLQISSRVNAAVCGRRVVRGGTRCRGKRRSPERCPGFFAAQRPLTYGSMSAPRCGPNQFSSLAKCMAPAVSNVVSVTVHPPLQVISRAGTVSMPDSGGAGVSAPW